MCDKLRDYSPSRLLYSITVELMGRKSEPQLPNNILPAYLPNSVSDFKCEKIANILLELDSCPVPASFEPFAGTMLSSPHYSNHARRILFLPLLKL